MPKVDSWRADEQIPRVLCVDTLRAKLQVARDVLRMLLRDVIDAALGHLVARHLSRFDAQARAVDSIRVGPTSCRRLHPK